MPLSFEQFERNTTADGFSPLPQDRQRLLLVPGNGDLLDYGTITPQIAAVCTLEPLPVRLMNGKHGAFECFGAAHILADHGCALGHFDYFSVQDFVDDTAQNFDAVYAGYRGRTILVARTLRNPTMNRLLVIQAVRRGAFFSVVSGWMADARRRINGTLLAERVIKNDVSVWECRAPH